MAGSPKNFDVLSPIEKVVVIDTQPTEATGHPIEDSLDYNLDTYWKPTSSADQTIVLDLQTAQTINGLALWIHNYDTDHSNSTAADVVLSYSNDDISYTPWKTKAFLNLVGTPIWYQSIGQADESHRYWQIEFKMMNTVVEISQFFLHQRYVVTTNSGWPEDNETVFFNRSSKGPGGRKQVSGVNGNFSTKFERTFLISGDTDKDALVNAFKGSFGSRFPFVLMEGVDQTLAKVCRFTHDELAENEIDYQLYNPSITFETIPYIEDGQVF